MLYLMLLQTFIIIIQTIYIFFLRRKYIKDKQLVSLAKDKEKILHQVEKRASEQLQAAASLLHRIPVVKKEESNRLMFN